MYDSLDYAQIGLHDLEQFTDQREVPELDDKGVERTDRPTLTKITVPHRAGREILEHLDLMGFSATHLYDSYEGAAIDVIDDYTISRKSGRVWDVRPPIIGSTETNDRCASAAISSLLSVPCRNSASTKRLMRACAQSVRTKRRIVPSRAS